MDSNVSKEYVVLEKLQQFVMAESIVYEAGKI